MTQKYEREIEEILRNMDRLPQEPAHQRAAKKLRRWRGSLPQFPSGNWRRYLTVQWFMVASIALIMLAFVIRIVSPSLAWYLNTLGFVLFVAAIAMAVFHISGSRPKKRWRGQVVDISSRDSSWWPSLLRRLRLWWYGRRW